MIKLKDIFIQEKKNGPSKSFNKLATNFQKEAVKHQDLVDKQKSLAKQFVDEKNSASKGFSTNTRRTINKGFD